MKRMMLILSALLCAAVLFWLIKPGDSFPEAPSAENSETVETDPAVQPPTETTEAVELWIPREAPAIRNTIPEEEKLAEQKRLLDKGTLLFSGKTDEGYYPADIGWLTAAQPEDAIALVWACDDITHGGWGVLGASVNGMQKDIAAISDKPDKERLMVCSVRELLDMAGLDSAAEIETFSLGAWNGGRIAGLYFLPEEAADELYAYLTVIEEAEKIIHTYDGSLSNENAIESAQAVYAYLQEIWKTGCLTGQMESTWMYSSEYEMNYIQKHTGKLPAIRGLDFMGNDFRAVTSSSIKWWGKGGIPHICWHTGAEFGSGYTESLEDDIDWNEAFIPGSKTNQKLVSGMDRAVPYLQKLEDAGVPVLWRPFHELDGGWFWWAKGGSENFVRLWQMMYSRYTDYWGLDNLIWVLGYSGAGVNMAAWYPGDDYVDLIGADSYTSGANGSLYEQVAAIAPEGMPIVFHECGTIPTQAQMEQENAPWVMFMVWHTEHLTSETYNTIDSLKEIYNSDYFITLDELPDFTGTETEENP